AWITRLNFYRSRDLKLLESGLFPDAFPPYSRFTFQLGAAGDIQFVPDQKELILQAPGPTPAQPAQMADTRIYRLKRELDAKGFYKLADKYAIVPRSYGVRFLRV